MQRHGYCFKSRIKSDKAPIQEKIPRVSENYLVMSNEIESLIQIYPFAKPTFSVTFRIWSEWGKILTLCHKIFFKNHCTLRKHLYLPFKM